jgi:D-lactate dehydrogenase (cytochrome)
MDGAFSHALTALLGDRYLYSRGSTSQYRAVEGHAYDGTPGAVALPRTAEEVAAIHTICNSHRVPVVPYGSGSSVEGQVAANSDSLVIDLRGMNRIVRIDVDDMTATVEAGVTRLQLNAALRGTGLFFPVDPGADATIGGMAATRASGTNAVRYGTMRENTLSVKAVLANGEFLHTGARVRKAANGYDLVRLLVGSEGTLATFTELSIRLQPRPEATEVAVLAFPDVACAVNMAIAMLHQGVPIARVELFDAITIGALNRHSNLALREVPTLFVEFHGSEAVIAEQRDAVTMLAADMAASDIDFGAIPSHREKLWSACHNRYYACRAIRPGAEAIATDVCVPISRLASVIEETLADIHGLPFPATLHGHVGDGNFHTVLLMQKGDPEEEAAYETYSRSLVRRALAAGGTCSGEHGVGLGKQAYLAEEHGGGLNWMRGIKRLFDPNNIMNPGKNIDVPGI